MSDDGFFSRWSKRKDAVREGKPVEAEPRPSPRPAPAVAAETEEAPPVLRSDREELPAPPPPTLEEALALTPESDFTRFVAPGVSPEVKNAALKKLFSDPHFNIMDRLDTYIDDYSQPDPIPTEMLKQLASAKFLGLFDEKKEAHEVQEPRDPQAPQVSRAQQPQQAQQGTQAPRAEGREVANDPAVQSVAQSGASEHTAAQPEDHADTDLRLQQDDAPGPAGPGQGAG